jgi:carbamoyltransferase
VFIRGISAFYHDSAACLIRNGELIAAAQEERFSRIKNDAGFPSAAVDFCLAEAGITIEAVELIAFYEKPLLKFDRLVETQLAYAPRGFGNSARILPTWLREKLYHRRLLDEGLETSRKQYVFARHHDSHAASAFYPSPFREAAIITADGVGEWATTTIAHGQDARITPLDELNFPHSLGLLYSAATACCGFRVNQGEYKMMGLAPYGEPRFASKIRDELLDLKADGSFRLNMDAFAFGHTNSMFSAEFARIFDGPSRGPGKKIDQRHMDVARSFQVVTEEVMLRIASHAHARSGCRDLVMVGGVALNCVANGRIVRESPFERVWIQPAAGDAGGAFGAALFVWHQLLEHPREPNSPDGQHGSLLGPSFTQAEICRTLDDANENYEEFDPEEALFARAAELLDDGLVVGHFGGREEFGPRALGSRSILGDPRNTDMQRVLNEKTKFRESFRPFAPAVLEEHASEYFDLGGAESPYMLVVADVIEAEGEPANSADTSFERMKQLRSPVPAVTHVDCSARVQTVDERHSRLRGLIRAFHDRTGVPCPGQHQLQRAEGADCRFTIGRAAYLP